MNRLQRWYLDTFHSPQLRQLMEAAGGIKRAVRQMEIGKMAEDTWQAVTKEREWEMQQASEMLAGPTPAVIRESGGGGTVQLKERFWELELALEDRGWQRQLAVSQLEFSRYGIQQIILISRLYFIKNPLIRRGVKVSSIYVFGRGVDISSEDERANAVIQQFLTDNAQELGHCGLVEKDQTLQTDGNLYFSFFSNKLDGRTRVRTIDAIEIQQIVCNPDDSSEPWFYYRYWESKTFDTATGITTMKPAYAWYPAAGDFPDRPHSEAIGGHPVMWDTPVIHVAVGKLPKWIFGCPEVYSQIDWARAVKKYLEDWSSITEGLRRFAWTVETQGGAQAIQQFSNLFTTTLGDGGTQTETQPPANVGSTFVTGPGNKITPMKTSGAISSPADVTYLIHMVCAASGLPETFYGDSQRGNLATAQTLDRPTELQFLQRQELWREIVQRVLAVPLRASLNAPNGKLQESYATNAHEVEILMHPHKIDKHGVVIWEAVKPNPKNILIKVDFPSILEHDINARIGAIVEAMTLNGFEVSGIDEKTAVGMLLSELGYEDWPQLVDTMYPDKGPVDPDNAGAAPQYDPVRTRPEPEPPAGDGQTGIGGDISDAPPHPPGPRTPKVKRVPPPKEAERAIALLRRTLVALKERR